MGAACCNYQPKDQQALNLANKIKSNQAITIDQQIRLDAIVYNALSHRNAIVKLQAYIRGYLVRKNCRFKRKAGDEIDFKMRNHSREINASAKLASSRKGIQGASNRHKLGERHLGNGVTRIVYAKMLMELPNFRNKD